MKQTPLIITQSTFMLKKGRIVESYTKVKNGVMINDFFLSNESYVILTEKLSSDDEKRIKEIIKQQLRVLLWNLYTKQNLVIGS